ncbi:MAG: hypothetical protein L0154_03075 [Chloroflexi bacterium]|nr:hypothetical protein [Chloroflexota bacterium]
MWFKQPDLDENSAQNRMWIAAIIGGIGGLIIGIPLYDYFFDSVSQYMIYVIAAVLAVAGFLFGQQFLDNSDTQDVGFILGMIVGFILAINYIDLDNILVLISVGVIIGFISGFVMVYLGWGILPIALGVVGYIYGALILKFGLGILAGCLAGAGGGYLILGLMAAYAYRQANPRVSSPKQKHKYFGVEDSPNWENNRDKPGIYDESPQEQSQVKPLTDQDIMYASLEYARRKQLLIEVLFRIITYKDVSLIIVQTLPANEDGGKCVCIYFEENTVTIEGRDYLEAMGGSIPLNSINSQKFGQWGLLRRYLTKHKLRYRTIEKTPKIKHRERMDLVEEIKKSLKQGKIRPKPEDWLKHPGK